MRKYCNYMDKNDFWKDLLGEMKYLVYMLFIYLDIDIEVYTIAIILMGVNTATGVGKVLRTDYREFSTRKLLWGLVGKMGLLLIPMLLALTAKGLGHDMSLSVELVLKLLIVSEALSAITNIYTMKTKVVVKDIDIITMIFRAIRIGAHNLIAKYTKLDPEEFFKSEDESDKDENNTEK